MIVYTGGTFDLFHSGHVNFLRQCKKIAGEDGTVVVSLNTDEFVSKYKGKTPIYPYIQRKEILESCKFVDKVIENFGDADSKPAIAEVEPDVIVVGSDWAKKDYYAQMQFDQAFLDFNGITLIYIPYTEGISSTIVRQKIQDSLPRQGLEEIPFTAIVVAHGDPVLLDECLTRLGQQTYKNIEVDVYYSGLELPKQLPDYGIRINFFNQPNKEDWGQEKVAYGINSARGEYLGIFNIDDIYRPDYIEKMLMELYSSSHGKLDLVYCNREEKDGSIVEGEPVLNKGDRGMFVIRSEFARMVGYNHRDYGADGRFLEEVIAAGAKHKILAEVLYTHK
jgi:glycerol-3-phosphate cytidylyltransferase